MRIVVRKVLYENVSDNVQTAKIKREISLRHLAAVRNIAEGFLCIIGSLQNSMHKAENPTRILDLYGWEQITYEMLLTKSV